MSAQVDKPLIALTMGDVAGIGPEIVARVVKGGAFSDQCRFVVVGSEVWLQHGLNLSPHKNDVTVKSLRAVEEYPDDAKENEVYFWDPSTVAVDKIKQGTINAASGQAAYDWLIAATDAAINNQIDGIVTAPLNKAALHAAGLNYPGHTEIIAERCGVDDFAMMLYLPSGKIVQSPHGLGVAHVTLHTSIASVPNLLSTDRIYEKIQLVEHFLKRIGCELPRLGVCALNPHGGEQGLFGDEESRIIEPAVARAQEDGIQATGPFPADTLLQRAVQGEFDGIAAMYHDQGHIALKLIGFQKAVNVTLGIPIVRTSPSHGTAFDIVGRGIADDAGMREAIRVAIHLIHSRN